MLQCHVCKRNLLRDVDNSMVHLIKDRGTKVVDDVIVCCKGECDEVVTKKYKVNRSNAWQELREYNDPSHFDSVKKDYELSDEAYDKLNKIHKTFN